eukprot:1387795-Karenia_brevis.AAC.1
MSPSADVFIQDVDHRVILADLRWHDVRFVIAKREKPHLKGWTPRTQADYETFCQGCTSQDIAE